MMTDLENGRLKHKDVWKSKEEFILYLRHLAAYEFAKSYVGDKSVLEIGCGTGYGAYFLIQYASSLKGLDTSKESILYCKKRYKKEKLEFMQTNGIKLPFKNDLFDVVISFQVIEHIDPVIIFEYLSEIKRVLKPHGSFIVSTPNKKLRLLPFQNPWNHRHKREYKLNEFLKILNEVFTEVSIYGLYGEDIVQNIMLKSVKQNPVEVYFKRPLIRFIKFISPSSLKLIKRLYVRMRITQHDDEIQNNEYTEKGEFSTNDFNVDTKHLKSSLDFIGVCIK